MCCKDSKYVTDPQRVRTTIDYTIEFCITCDRDMQFDIQTGQCVLCGSDNPFGLWEEHTDEEWDEYYRNYKQTAQCCRLFKKRRFTDNS